MERLIEALVTLAVASLVVAGGHYTLEHIEFNVKRMALQKAATPMNSLEHAAQIMTGSKLDY